MRSHASVPPARLVASLAFLLVDLALATVATSAGAAAPADPTPAPPATGPRAWLAWDSASADPRADSTRVGRAMGPPQLVILASGLVDSVQGLEADVRIRPTAAKGGAYPDAWRYDQDGKGCQDATKLRIELASSNRGARPALLGERMLKIDGMAWQWPEDPPGTARVRHISAFDAVAPKPWAVYSLLRITFEGDAAKCAGADTPMTFELVGVRILRARDQAVVPVDVARGQVTWRPQ
jgi:hypothetical protein